VSSIIISCFLFSFVFVGVFWPYSSRVPSLLILLCIIICTASVDFIPVTLVPWCVYQVKGCTRKALIYWFAQTSSCCWNLQNNYRPHCLNSVFHKYATLFNVTTVDLGKIVLKCKYRVRIKQLFNRKSLLSS